jgi:hypothetical protein
MSGFAASSQEVKSYMNRLENDIMRELRNDAEIKLRARYDVYKAYKGVPCPSPYGTNWRKNQVYCEHYEKFMSEKKGGRYRKTKSKSRKARKTRRSNRK